MPLRGIITPGTSKKTIYNGLITKKVVEQLPILAQDWSAGGPHASKDVSVNHNTETPVPSTPETAEGTITTGDKNVVKLFVSDTHAPPEDPSGREIYGRLTEVANVWTITFYTWQTGHVATNLPADTYDYWYQVRSNLRDVSENWAISDIKEVPIDIQKIEDMGTDEAVVTKFLQPDGGGGVKWNTVSSFTNIWGIRLPLKDALLSGGGVAFQTISGTNKKADVIEFADNSDGFAHWELGYIGEAYTSIEFEIIFKPSSGNPPSVVNGTDTRWRIEQNGVTPNTTDVWDVVGTQVVTTHSMAIDPSGDTYIYKVSLTGTIAEFTFGDSVHLILGRIGTVSGDNYTDNIEVLAVNVKLIK